MPLAIHVNLVGDSRPRPDETHLIAQHVEQLRQLVDAGSTYKCAEACYAWIACHLEDRVTTAVVREWLTALNPALDISLMRAIARLHSHRAELDELEGAAIEPDAGLVKEDWPTVDSQNQ